MSEGIDRKKRVLNLYAGIGGNRKLWKNVEVTAVENNKEIADVYKKYFPDDKVVITDAHDFLLEHYKEFDFIWSSPPCPSHSMFRKNFSCNIGAKPVYPNMRLYEEILLLQGYFKGKWVVENVKSWYKPLIEPQEIQRHYFWSNFKIGEKEFPKDSIVLTGGKHREQRINQAKRLAEMYGFDITKIKGDKRNILRNCVNPELGLHIFNCAFDKKQTNLIERQSKGETRKSKTDKKLIKIMKNLRGGETK